MLKLREIVMDGEAWHAAVHGVEESQTRFSGWRTAITSGGPMIKTPHTQCRGPGSIPGQGTRSHMPQLRPGTAK